jgi:hypothetical protein
VVEHVFIVDERLHIFKEESRKSGCELKQFDNSFYLHGLKKREKPMLELRFSKGRLIYSTNGVFGVNGSYKFHFNLDCLTPYSAVITSNPTGST